MLASETTDGVEGRASYLLVLVGSQDVALGESDSQSYRGRRHHFPCLIRVRGLADFSVEIVSRIFQAVKVKVIRLFRFDVQWECVIICL